MRTDDLIDAIAGDATPVRRLRPPVLRVGAWLGMALPATLLVVLAMGPRPDLAAELRDPAFVVRLLAALAAAVVAAWAALSAGVPGTARWKLFAPVAPTALWLATVGQQCWAGWPQYGLAGPVWEADCVLSVAAVSLLPAAAIFILIRRGARLDAGYALSWGGVAIAALADAGLRLFHGHDAAVMDIAWQFVTVLALAACGWRALPTDR